MKILGFVPILVGGTTAWLAYVASRDKELTRLCAWAVLVVGGTICGLFLGIGIGILTGRIPDLGNTP